MVPAARQSAIGLRSDSGCDRKPNRAV